MYELITYLKNTHFWLSSCSTSGRIRASSLKICEELASIVLPPFFEGLTVYRARISPTSV